MLELNDLLLLGLLCAVFSAIFSAIGAIATHFIRNRDVERLYVKVDSLEQAARGAIGRSKTEQNKEDMEAALIEGMTAIKGGAKPEEVIPALAAKYPNVALKLVKKFGIGL